MILALLALVLALFWWLMMSLERYGAPFRQAGARIQGHLLEVLLYGAFPRVMLRSLWAVTRACGSLSWALLGPSLWFCLPLLPVLILAASLYSQRPAQVGDPVLVWLRGRGDWALAAPPGVELEVNGFLTPDGATRYWRLKPARAGSLQLVFSQGGRKVEKSLRVGEGLDVLSERRLPFGLSWLAEPLELPLPGDSGVSEIGVDYSPRHLAYAGWSVPWWLLLLLAFVAWSWLLTFLPAPGKRTLRKQRSAP